MPADDLTIRAVLAEATEDDRRFIEFVDDRTRYFSGAMTGRRYRKRTALRLVEAGVLEAFGAYKVDDYDNLTDHFGTAYRFTDLGRECARLITEGSATDAR